MWLARHAPLLQSLKITGWEVANTTAESAIAAALAAGSGKTSGPITRARAAAVSLKQQQSNTIAAAAGTYSPVRPLPLRMLALGDPRASSSGSILHALHDSPQLAVLQVDFAVGIPARQLAIAARAVATWEALEDIVIKQGTGVQAVPAHTTAIVICNPHVSALLVGGPPQT
jgi:hypothetical protein